MPQDMTEAALIEGLDRAIDAGQIAPWFQPVMCPRGIDLLSAEALPRWDDPAKGVIPAGVFLPAAIRHGRLEAIVRILVDKSCMAYADWRARDIAPPVLGVNFTAAELVSGVARDVLAWALDRAGMAPEQISAEVGEDVISGDDAEAAIAALLRLDDMGVRLCLDDFGAGPCDRERIGRVPFQTTKIDRRAIAALEEDESAAERLAWLVSAAHEAGLSIIAKGVETRTQIDILSRLGCDGQQGFAIARPMPEDSFVEWLDLNTWPTPQTAPASAGRGA